MRSYTSYIVDDEPPSIRSLRKKLEYFPEIEIVGESSNMAKAIKEIKQFNPEILFLDIHLSEGTAFDLLNKFNYDGKVILISSYDEFAFRAFEISALDYLLKPVSSERLSLTIEKIKSADHENETGDFKENIKYKYSDRIFVLERNQIRFILLESITMISAARDYTTIETVQGTKCLIMRSMSEWINRLPEEHFIRIHRSFIVNLNHIDKIIRNSSSSAKVYMKFHPYPVSLSRTYYNILKYRYL